MTAPTVVDALQAHWRAAGVPSYARFGTDTRFRAHQFPDTLGRVTRLCLELALVSVFAPPREAGFHGAMESFNGRWQSKVWTRFRHDSLASLQA